jgi:hypothetical protein
MCVAKCHPRGPCGLCCAALACAPPWCGAADVGTLSSRVRLHVCMYVCMCVCPSARASVCVRSLPHLLCLWPGLGSRPWSPRVAGTGGRVVGTGTRGLGTRTGVGAGTPTDPLCPGVAPGAMSWTGTWHHGGNGLAPAPLPDPSGSPRRAGCTYGNSGGLIRHPPPSAAPPLLIY